MQDLSSKNGSAYRKGQHYFAFGWPGAQTDVFLKSVRYVSEAFEVGTYIFRVTRVHYDIETYSHRT